MLELTRTVRFCPDPQRRDTPPRANTFAAWPAMRGLGRYYELQVRCAGEADPVTGYFMNITHIDAAVREHALPAIEQALAVGAGCDVPLGSLMRRLCTLLDQPLHQSVVELRLVLTPYYSIQATVEQGRDITTMSHVTIREQFEFSAAHRLHVPGYSDQKNREIFGKCNNPTGHGHNYRLEVAVRAPIDDAGHVAPVEQLDALVDREVIQKLDHKHLNCDVPQFENLNPSVEHIAKVIWDMLAAPAAAAELMLEEVRVWETGKTVCTYRGPGARAEGLTSQAAGR